MEIKGIVTSGKGKGAYFMSLPVYKDQFKDKLNFSPFPGTLNIRIGPEEIDHIHKIPREKLKIIQGKENYGEVLLIKAVLNDKINGAMIFPKKTTHGENILEFIAAQNIKDELGVKDGDCVNLSLQC